MNDVFKNAYLDKQSGRETVRMRAARQESMELARNTERAQLVWSRISFVKPRRE